MQLILLHQHSEDLPFRKHQLTDNMRDIITGSAFDHNKMIQEGFIKSKIVRGGSSKVEQVMRTAGCDPLTPAAAVAVYLAMVMLQSLCLLAQYITLS